MTSNIRITGTAALLAGLIVFAGLSTSAQEKPASKRLKEGEK